MSDDLAVGLASKRNLVFFKPIPQLGMVLNDPVVYNGNAL